MSTAARRRRRKAVTQPHQNRISRVRIPTDFKVPDDVSSITNPKEEVKK